MDRREYYDNGQRRQVMRWSEGRRQLQLATNRNLGRHFPEYVASGGMEGLTEGAIQFITREMDGMSMHERAVAFENNPLMARHFPNLDPRNAPPPPGPVLPLDRQLLVSFIRRWDPEQIARYFHLCPWMRTRFQEFQPPGGWPDRLLAPLRLRGVHGDRPFQGPMERYEDWPIQDPQSDVDSWKYVQSRTPSRRPDRSLSPHRLRMVLSPERSPSPRRRLRLDMPSPVRMRSRSEASTSRQMSPARRLSPMRTPSPRIRGEGFMRTPSARRPSVDTAVRLIPPGTRATFYAQPPDRGPQQHFDPGRYRRGYPPSGYIAGAPPPPIYHDFYPHGDLYDMVSVVTNLGVPVYPPVDVRDEVGYNRPATRDYPMRDDNFSPAVTGSRPNVRYIEVNTRPEVRKA